MRWKERIRPTLAWWPFIALFLYFGCSGPAGKDKGNTNTSSDPEVFIKKLDQATSRSVDTTAPFLLSVINSNECVMCFGLISRKFPELRDKYGIPERNSVFLFPDMREVEIDPTLDRYLPEIKKTVQIAHRKKTILSALKQRSDLPSGSYYMVLHPSGKIIKTERFKKRKSPSEIKDKLGKGSS